MVVFCNGIRLVTTPTTARAHNHLKVISVPLFLENKNKMNLALQILFSRRPLEQGVMSYPMANFEILHCVSGQLNFHKTVLKIPEMDTMKVHTIYY